MMETTSALGVDRDLLRRVLSVESYFEEEERMRAFVRAHAAEIGASVREERGNLYLTRGEAAVVPGLVAHLDTRHPILPPGAYEVRHDATDDVWHARNRRAGEPAGVGGDDKVGIFIALTLLADLPAAKVALFREEEWGQRGAHDADLAFFADCAFAIEADRKGNADFVREIDGASLHDDAFAAAVAPILARHGYAECLTGGKTDVHALVLNGLPIACANLSCGYFDPHTPRETVRTADVGRALALVRDICVALGGARWETGRRGATP